MSLAARADRQQAADWLRRGRAYEAQHTPDALAQALVCYDQVISVLRNLPATEAARDLGIAYMNRGNALQQLGRHGDAVQAYDDAIGCLTPLVDDPAARNSAGAAWMNRGHALQLAATPEALAEALRSHDEAIRLLQTLDPAANPAFRLNLAGSWLNRAQVLLAGPAPDFTAVRAALSPVLSLTQPIERTDATGADLSLKARHAFCDTLSRQLPPGDAAWIAEAGDEIDSAMDLVRHWETLRPRRFRALARPLYRFGVQFYLSHQPQFLAEFLLENLDPSRAPGAMPADPEMHAIAAEALARAQSDNYNRRLAMPTGAEAARLQEIAEALHAAETQRTALHQIHIGPQVEDSARI